MLYLMIRTNNYSDAKKINNRLNGYIRMKKYRDINDNMKLKSDFMVVATKED